MRGIKCLRSGMVCPSWGPGTVLSHSFGSHDPLVKGVSWTLICRYWDHLCPYAYRSHPYLHQEVSQYWASWGTASMGTFITLWSSGTEVCPFLVCSVGTLYQLPWVSPAHYQSQATWAKDPFISTVAWDCWADLHSRTARPCSWPVLSGQTLCFIHNTVHSWVDWLSWSGWSNCHSLDTWWGWIIHGSCSQEVITHLKQVTTLGVRLI